MKVREKFRQWNNTKRLYGLFPCATAFSRDLYKEPENMDDLHVYHRLLKHDILWNKDRWTAQLFISTAGKRLGCLKFKVPAAVTWQGCQISPRLFSPGLERAARGNRTTLWSPVWPSGRSKCFQFVDGHKATEQRRKAGLFRECTSVNPRLSYWWDFAPNLQTDKKNNNTINNCCVLTNGKAQSCRPLKAAAVPEHIGTWRRL